jgi:hypothetical protein
MDLGMQFNAIGYLSIPKAKTVKVIREITVHERAGERLRDFVDM